MTLETIAPLSEDPIFKLPAVAARAAGQTCRRASRSTPLLHHHAGHDPRRHRGRQETAILPRS
jgi:hypothetical protein